MIPPLDLLPYFILVAIASFAIGWGVCKWCHPRIKPPTWEQRQFLKHD